MPVNKGALNLPCIKLIFLCTEHLQLPNDTSSKLPVWFFLYPGRHIFGDAHSAHYGPHYIMDHPVIFVTAAYRLGPFGNY